MIPVCCHLATPLNVANQPHETVEKGFNSTELTKKLKDAFLADPTKQSRERNMKEWAGLMGAGSILTHIPQLASGDPTQIATVAGLTAGNALKGSAIGSMLTGGKDTLLKSALIPASVAHIGGKILNSSGQALGLDSGEYGGIDFDEDARAGLLGALGAGSWALRNRYNKKRYYV